MLSAGLLASCTGGAQLHVTGTSMIVDGPDRGPELCSDVTQNSLHDDGVLKVEEVGPPQPFPKQAYDYSSGCPAPLGGWPPFNSRTDAGARGVSRSLT